MLISVLSIPATRWGAALPDACKSQWTVGQSGLERGRHAFAPPSGGGRPETGLSGFGLLPATRVTGASGIVGVPAAVRGAGVADVKGALATRKQATYGLPTDNSKQNVQMTTRVNVDGGGAPGPEPEREPALHLRPGQIPFRPRTHTGSAAYVFRRPGPTLWTHTMRTSKREGMAPMQWPDASMSATSATGFEAMPAEFDTITMVPAQGGGFVVSVPSGLNLPCTEDPELFFAEAPADVEAAKALCRGCRARVECLAGALERREPWGVWGGELFLRGTVVPRKRPRGRPRKDDPGLVAKADEQAA